MTSLAQAGITDPPAPVRRATRRSDAAPGTVTPSTQEIRLAIVFTGGVSLAVWMGGVARELNLLLQASARRAADDGADVGALPPHADRVCRLYQRLLELTDAQVAVDVLAGTSAGGINAALLGLANARGGDLGPLREMWLAAGDFGHLLRDPRDPAPPSLLRGDERMLVELRNGIEKIGGDAVDPANAPSTDVYITATLLSPETRTFSDDYGTQITDADHHALFHFDQDALARDGVAAPLAVAARSSASFPGAFEPSFVAVGKHADAGHPNMSAYIDATRSHWAADGGLLANRPIAPVLQAIFDREADRHVRRALLYVVPTSVPPAAAAVDDKASPLGLSEALMCDLGAVLNQSVAADLAAIKEHNDRTGAVADARLRLASLGRRLPRGAWLADAAAWQDYRRRQGEWLAAPLLAELTRQLAAPGSHPWNGKLFEPNSGLDERLRTMAINRVTENWPAAAPTDAAQALRDAVSLGRSAFDAAKATLIHILRLGYFLATTVEQRDTLATLNAGVLKALGGSRQTDLRTLVGLHLAEVSGERSLDSVAADLIDAYAGAQGTTPQLEAAWREIRMCAAKAVPLVGKLVAGWRNHAGHADAVGNPSARATRRDRGARAADELENYVGFLRRGDVIAQLLDLHVAVRSVLPVRVEVQQPVELIQVSADTRSVLAQRHPTARTKLTGLQAHHFGAFYKRSWRANDWMWGRLDGVGWLVHVLLAPRRILTVMENDNVKPGKRAETFARRLYEALHVDVPDKVRVEHLAELAFLDEDRKPLPPSLPRLAIWAATQLQKHVVADELPVVAEEVRRGEDGKLSRDARTWLDSVDAASGNGQPDGLADLLDACPVPSETLEREAADRTPLYLRTVTHVLAVATSAVTGVKRTPQPLRPAFATARTITRTAYLAARSTDGKRGKLTMMGLALLAASVLAMLTDISLLGAGGFIAFGIGALVLALSVGRRAVDVTQALLAFAVLLVASAPWLPWLDRRVFSWLRDTAVPAVDEHAWSWPALLFALLLPPVIGVRDLLRRRRTTRHRKA